jgi:hypothetical protein
LTTFTGLHRAYRQTASLQEASWYRPAVARYGSELPDVYPALTSLGLTVLAVLLTVATVRHHVWVLSVILALVALYFGYATFTWIRKIIRRR